MIYRFFLKCIEFEGVGMSHGGNEFVELRN